MDTISKKQLKPSKDTESTTIEFDLLCCCYVPQLPGLGPWIACDKCNTWYLQECEGVDGSKITEDESYVCNTCYNKI